MLRPLIRSLICPALLSCSVLAQAALPTVTMSFDQLSATVGPNDSIDVFVTLTIAANSAPLVFNSASGAPFGFATSDLPVQGRVMGLPPNQPPQFANFTNYSSVSTSVSYYCDSTFMTGCPSSISTTPYFFTFNGLGTPAQPSFNGLTSANLQPGQSFSYLFGTFKPTGGGPVPVGTYSLFGAGAGLSFNGRDALGRSLTAFVDMGRTCPTNAATCTFTRTVVAAVPEPHTYALLAAGLFAVVLSARRRRAS
jgi:PEP-CTERM motif